MVRLILKSIVYPSIPLPIPHPKCYFMYILASFYHYVQTLSSFSVSAFSGPLKSTFLDDLQKNKNGIHVSTETDFGKVDLGGRKKLTVWIQNKGETNQVFLRAHLPAECTQIKVQGLYLHSLCTGKWNKKKISVIPAVNWQGCWSFLGRLMNIHIFHIQIKSFLVTENSLIFRTVYINCYQVLYLSIQMSSEIAILKVCRN